MSLSPTHGAVANQESVEEKLLGQRVRVFHSQTLTTGGSLADAERKEVAITARVNSVGTVYEKRGSLCSFLLGLDSALDFDGCPIRHIVVDYPEYPMQGILIRRRPSDLLSEEGRSVQVLVALTWLDAPAGWASP